MINSSRLLGVGLLKKKNESKVRSLIFDRLLSNIERIDKKNLIEVRVNGGRPFTVASGMTVMQACEQAGVHIPHFCYHKRLSIAGNCRMCLVEVEKNAKPVASCAMPALNGMHIRTHSEFARKARESVLEFILANHPLDCPVCDQGGECDLQDLCMNFGSDRSRFTDIRHLAGKRAVVDKDFGPLIGTSMTKCIQCTRCVRFANQVAGVADLGVSGRGSQMQIGMYIEKLLMSELSGNVIDLCPVGALISKPYAFTARPWELRKVESIDVLDALGSNIVIASRAGSLMRISPRLNEDINEEWISDKARFSYDALKYQRLTTPTIRRNDRFEECLSWKKALNIVAQKMRTVHNKASISAIVGDLTDCETIMVTKDLLESLGSSNVFIGEFETIDLLREQQKSLSRASYTFSNGIRSVEQSDLIILINSNPRFDAPVLNARIRKAWMENGAEVALCGPREIDLTFPYTHLGDTLCGVRVESFKQKYKNPLVILGTHKLTSEVFNRTLQLANELERDCACTSDWSSVFNVLHNRAAIKHASSVGALDLRCKSLVDREATSVDHSEIVILLGYDQREFKRSDANKLVIYIGHHGDVNAANADIILPGCAYTEKTATYVNTEGRAQSTLRAVSPPGMGRDDWKIVKAIAEVNGVRLPYETLDQVRERLAQISPHFVAYDRLLQRESVNFNGAAPAAHSSAHIPLRPKIVNLRDFYMTDSISRNSIVMSKAVRAVDSMSEQDCCC